MPDTHVTKNYMAHGGDEFVVGGKLTFLPGAVVEGAEGLFDGIFDGMSEGDAAQRQIVHIAHIADSEATTVAALRADFNALLAALRTAGLMAEAPVVNQSAAEQTGTEQNSGGLTGTEQTSDEPTGT